MIDGFHTVQSLLPPAGIARELADRDARMLLDIGLVRSEDGALRLAEDPSQVLPTVPRSAHGVIGALVAAVRAMLTRPRAMERRTGQSCLDSSL